MRCARCGKVLDTQCKRVICNVCMADINRAMRKPPILNEPFPTDKEEKP